MSEIRTEVEIKLGIPAEEIHAEFAPGDVRRYGAKTLEKLEVPEGAVYVDIGHLLK